jgi:hypothetical protein
MTKIVLGPTGTKRRRWTLIAPLFLVALVGLILAAGAQAVHDVSVFQLDTPSADAQVTVGSTVHHDDWDVICKANPSTCTLLAGYPDPGAPASTLKASAHVNDGALNASIFVGGGSKDISGIQSGPWAWKNESGGLPDKDNLLHAYAARYSVDPSTECPVATGLTKCELIYFGSDRYDNSGDATQAFWFLQNQLSLGSNKVGGALGFTGSHRDGDLLVISEFSNGGTTSTITVYRWTGNDATGGLTFLAGGPNQKCGGSTPDPFCGIVNSAPPAGGTIAPWSFLDKSGSTNFLQGELYEAGINLSDPSINLAGECFSSFVAETRSSTSTSAQLKDFVLGQFQVCAPALTTQASTNSTVLPGTPVTDSATVTITGAQNPADATGSVTFYLCGPSATATACSSSTGTVVGSSKTLVDTSNPANANDGISGATSDQVNTSTSPLQPGFYCFAAAADLTNYADPAEFSNNTTECFSVKDTTAITTAQKWLPQDTATISTGSGGAAPSGTVVFSLYANGTCSGTPVTFTDTTAPYETNNTTYITSSTTVSWRATFTPTDPNAFDGSTSGCEVSTLTITN